MNAAEQQIATVLPDAFSAVNPSRESVCDGPIAEGRRNAHLASLAGSMRHRGMTPEAIAAALLEENTRRCDPPLSEREVRDVASSIGRYAPARGRGLPVDGLLDAVDVAAEGRAIATAGVQYVIDRLIPDYGVLGMNVAYAKVGKTSFGHAAGAAVAGGTVFVDQQVKQRRVLDIAAEDPPEYTAWLARDLTVPAGAMTFYRRPIRFDTEGLDAITATVMDGGYGLVLVSSWQAVIAGLMKDENDNAGAVAVVERVKLAARTTGVPWLIDAHSGKGEDQSDDADPTRAMRGASAAAGAADFMLSLRYAEGPFSTRRRLSGKGRFVSFEPMLLDYDLNTGAFAVLSEGKRRHPSHCGYKLSSRAYCGTGRYGRSSKCLFLTLKSFSSRVAPITVMKNSRSPRGPRSSRTASSGNFTRRPSKVARPPTALAASSTNVSLKVG